MLGRELLGGQERHLIGPPKARLSEPLACVEPDQRVAEGLGAEALGLAVVRVARVPQHQHPHARLRIVRERLAQRREQRGARAGPLIGRDDHEQRAGGARGQRGRWPGEWLARELEERPERMRIERLAGRCVAPDREPVHELARVKHASGSSTALCRAAAHRVCPPRRCAASSCPCDPRSRSCATISRTTRSGARGCRRAATRRRRSAKRPVTEAPTAGSGARPLRGRAARAPRRRVFPRRPGRARGGRGAATLALARTLLPAQSA